MNYTVHTLHTSRAGELKSSANRTQSCFFCPALGLAWDTGLKAKTVDVDEILRAIEGGRLRIVFSQQMSGRQIPRPAVRHKAAQEAVT